MSARVRARIRASTHRLIASRYPTVGVFDDLTAEPEELTLAYLLESVTNDRLGALSHRLPLLLRDDIVRGPGATMVMAAFLHADMSGGRFTDGRMGAWYASLDVATAIDETVFHSTRRLRLSAGAFPCSIQMRQLVAKIGCTLVDIRGQKKKRADLYDPDDYSRARAFGIELRWPPAGRGENGIVYDSVRRRSGVNVCIFRPSLVALPVVQGDHYEYRWNAAGAVAVLRLSNVGRAGM